MEEIERRTGVKVEWVPWEGRPEGVPFLERTPEEAKKAHARHQALAAGYGMRIGLHLKRCRTRRAHQATLFARDQGRFEAFRDAVFRARFQDDRDIDDSRVLLELAEGVGLEGSSLLRALQEEVYAGELDSLRGRGVALGVKGIPTYIVDGRPIWGPDPTDEVIAAIETRRERRA
jgi:predicted DsbA family dithiol-disulfide isomerase